MRAFISSLAVLCCFCLTALLITAFSAPQKPSELHLHVGFPQFDLGFQVFEKEIERTANTLQPGYSDEEIRQAVSHLRKSYKRIEFLVSFSDPEYIDDFINGAPLPALERNTGDITILEPEGLQVIDEVAFAPEGDKIDRKELTELLKLLKKSSAFYRKLHPIGQISSRELFEAIRLNIIRINSLGLSGFDTPGSANGIEEAIVSFAAMHEVLKDFLDELVEVDGALVKEINAQFATARELLENNPDFETFDRLEFLRRVINPMFKSTLRAQQALEIETINPELEGNTPLNYYADNLFSPELLNAHYFTRSSSAETGPKVVELGKLLFFDPILSLNNQRACASCHHPEKAFTDGMAKSVAFDFEGTVERNAPTLVNAVFSDRFFYDLRAGKLEDQIDDVVVNELEFHTSFPAMAEKLNTSDEYRDLFKEAFPQLGDRPIVKHTITSAIAAYVGSLVALNSPFDRFVRGESSELDPAVRRGFNLFMGKAACGTCHFAPTFNGLVPPYFVEMESEVLGVPVSSDTLNPVLDPDIGRWGGRLLERVDFYKHSFKTVTVRNIDLTAPYMHNGAYATLEEVLDFYNRGGGAGMGLEVEHQTLAPDPLDLSDTEQADIISFMRALTDTSGITSRPQRLPEFAANPELKDRRIGGEY